LNVSHPNSTPEVEGWAAKAGPTLESNATKKKNPQPTKTFDSFILQAWPRGIEQTSPFASIFHPFSTMPLRPKGHLPSGSKKLVISRPLSGTGSRQARDAIWTNVKKLYVPQT
jgi:hypothetical protein